MDFLCHSNVLSVDHACIRSCPPPICGNTRLCQPPCPVHSARSGKPAWPTAQQWVCPECYKTLQQWVHVETIHKSAQEVGVDIFSCICQLPLCVVIWQTPPKAFSFTKWPRTFASTSLRMQSTWRFLVSSPGAAQQRQLFLSLHGLCNGLLESILGVQGEDTVFELIGLLQCRRGWAVWKGQVCCQNTSTAVFLVLTCSLQ